jgi:hypothetical protein
MATIVTRAGKGTELTWQEMDDNFTNLNAATIPATGGAGSMLVRSGTGPTDWSWSYSIPAALWQLGGGNTGEVLSKASDDYYDFAWVTPSGAPITGSFTPLLYEGSNLISTQSQGQFQKVGDFVSVTWKILVNDGSIGTGDLYFSGLPFEMGSLPTPPAQAPFTDIEAFLITTIYDRIVLFLVGGITGNRAPLGQYIKSDNAVAPLTGAALVNGSYFCGNFTYYTNGVQPA